MKLNLLLVEDNQDLAATIIDYLELESMFCDHAANGVAGLQLIKNNQYDVIILDVSMPRMDGLTFCKIIREQGITTPVLMLTARDTLDDKLAGFNAGTDDYLVKPFEMLELVARVQVLRKRNNGQGHKLSLHGLDADFSQKYAHRELRPLQLSPSGWILLETLMRHAPNVVSRDQLSHALWGDNMPDSDALKVHLFKLRQQVDQENEIKLIHTVVGQGIAFNSKHL